MRRLTTTLPWFLAMALSPLVILGYSAAWIFFKPRTTVVDRVIFIGACIALCGGLLAMSTVLRRQRIEIDRRRAGQCLRCGYDLRATPGRCPECGTAAMSDA